MPESIILDEAKGATWVHIDASDPEDLHWLLNDADLAEDAKSLLQLPRKLSRRDHLDEGLIVVLCGIDPNQPLERDRVPSIAFLARHNQAITVIAADANSNANGILDVRTQLKTGTELRTPLQLLAALVVAYLIRLEPLIVGLSEETDDLEEQVLTPGSVQPIDALDAVRRKIFRIRRYLVAMQNVLRLIVTDPTVQTKTEDSEALTVAVDFVARYLESLMDCQGRSLLLHDKIESQLSHDMAGATYKLTIIATVFLPLTFVTGLLGMNVSGIPESHDPRGFWIVVGILVAIALVAWGGLLWKKRTLAR
jgi:zinc transporter